MIVLNIYKVYVYIYIYIASRVYLKILLNLPVRFSRRVYLFSFFFFYLFFSIFDFQHAIT